MKYLIFGDIHGRTIEPLESIILHEKPGEVLCLGDFDEPRIINQYLDIMKKHEKIKFRTVPGNHDDCVYYDKSLYSGTLDKIGKTCHGLHLELMQDEVAKGFIENLLKEESFRIHLRKTLPTLVIHGALAGYSHGTNQTIWTRLISEEHRKANFRKMAEQGIKVMIRGHDHEASYSCEGDVDEMHGHPGDSFDIRPDVAQVINPGPWFDGRYAMINTSGKKNPILQFRSV